MIKRVSKRLPRRMMLGPERGDVTRGFKELQYDKLHNLYTTPIIIYVITLRKI